MEKEELQEFKKLLLAKKQDLVSIQETAEESTKPVDLDQSSVGRLSRMDAMQSQAMAQENKRRRTIELTKIEAALERIENEEYGYCAACDEKIARKRLQLDPATPFCVACARSF